MQLLKPAWVSHDGKPIFSIDIHPNGERFATGGQGADSGRVVIWNMAPIIDEDAENDPEVPKLLCQMDNHLACVNVVRWSSDGNLLASGGDDKLVMIWKLAEGGPSMVFGGGGKINVKLWRCVATLRGHAGDVLDLAWAPHGGWLASCSVDNSIIIWNSLKFPEMVTTIRGHTGLVKGIAWDPVGKYLASQSDDRSLRVWRTGQWTEEVSVTNPFEECFGTTHVLRLSWSPDGQYLVSAHAMNGGGPTAQIIERDGWKQDKDFVGHRKAVTCVRFNSNILQTQLSGNTKPQRYCCCAIGSRDRSLSVWLTSLKRPLFVMQELFESSVLDLTWSANGLILMACSWDGSVACILFNDNELGKRLSNTDKNSLYEKLYGKPIEGNWTNNASQVIIENPEVLAIREQMAKKQTVNINLEKRVEGMKPAAVPETPEQARPINKQIETRLPDGKRRITPMFLVALPTPTKEVTQRNVTPEPPTTPVKPSTFCSSSSAKSAIIIETVKQTPDTLEINKDWKQRTPGPKIPPTAIKSITPEPRVSLAAQTENLAAVKCAGAKFTLHATNGQLKTKYGRLSRIQLIKDKSSNDTPAWETYVGSNVLCMSSSRFFVGVGCDDCTLHLLDIATGGRLLAPFTLPSPAISLSLSQSGRCCVLTRAKKIYIWDLWPINTAKILVENCELPPNAVATSCTLNKNDEPILLLVDGRSFCLNINLKTWLLLADPKDPLYKSLGHNLSADLPLASAQRSCTGQIRPFGPSTVELVHLENQLRASEALHSRVEYKFWLLAIVKHLLEKGPEWRLRNVLDDLLGPNQPSNSWNPKILGMDKHELLLQALGLFNSHLRWQRLYMEYFEQIPEKI